MFKRGAFFLLVISMLFLSSCAWRGGTMYNDDNQKAEARLEQVIKAINSHDKNALKSMFSKQAVDKAEDLDGRIDYLFGFVQGDIKSWKFEGGSAPKSNDYGHKIGISGFWYTVNTNKEEYLFYLLEYTEDTDHPENMGLYFLQVIKAKDRDTQFHGGSPETLPPGIYKPKE